MMLHDHACEIAQDLEDETNAHGEREAMGAVSDPEEELSEGEHSEDACE